MLASSGDKTYANAPREEVTPDDEALWSYYVENYTPVNYTDMVELEDMTDLQGEIACAGGSCEL